MIADAAAQYNHKAGNICRISANPACCFAAYVTGAHSYVWIYPQLSAAISIILPIYNTEPYLCCCLDSIRAQTFAEWECICIDDGSTDGSSAILTECAAKDSRFTVIHQKNRGPAAARNTGFARVRGEYFICMDSDDWAEPDYLERLYAAAKQADADIAVCDAVMTLKKETIIRRFPVTDMPDPVCSLLSNEVCGWLWVKLFRTELFAAHLLTAKNFPFKK